LREPYCAAPFPCCQAVKARRRICVLCFASWLFPHRERFFFRGLEAPSGFADLHAGFFARKSALGRSAPLRFRDPRTSFRRERPAVGPSRRPKTRHRLASAIRLAFFRFRRRRSAGDNAGVNCAKAGCECLSLAGFAGACFGPATRSTSPRNVG
jgi:hypothetical protein